MPSRLAIDAVTAAANVSAVPDEDIGLRAVRDEDVVAELRRLEGLDADEARALAREAVVHVGGHIEARARRSGRLLRQRTEVWWVPPAAVRT